MRVSELEGLAGPDTAAAGMLKMPSVVDVTDFKL
jgi:hypothetical protein